ncbi:MAG: T9SS type A sorting domain-containing protein [Prolixibacteraceae bacterium]
MKNIYISRITVALMGFLIAFSAHSQSLEITSGDVDLKIAETIELTAEYTDAEGIVQEVALEWSVEPDSLGTIADGIFTAEKIGEGFLYAQYGELKDTVEVEIEAVEEEDGDSPWGTLTILNEEIKLETGETVQLEAEYTDTTGTVQEVRIVWYVEPGYLAKIDRQDDMLTAMHAGEGMVFASYRGVKDSVEIEVEGSLVEDDDIEDDEEEVEPDYPKVKVIPGHIRLAAGDSVELVAFFVNENDKRITDTVFTWSVIPAESGTFPNPEENKFFAGDEPGKGYLVATLGEYADTVKLTVTEQKGWPRKGENQGRRLTIEPGDTVINVGDMAIIQYVADYRANGKGNAGATVEWSLSGDPVATIDASTGELTLTGETGLALVKAEYNNFGTSVELLVVDPDADTDINTITIHRVLPDGNELPAKVLNEGDTYRIGGLPFPLNILNGGTLHFPFGCISENITLYMFIPEEYAATDESNGEVSFDEEIIAGIKFSVLPEGALEVSEPYWFDIPVNLGIVFKKELLDSLGVTPDNLDVFFADNTGFVAEGTENVAVDTVKNKIYAAIEHFSTIVVRAKSSVTASPEMQMQQAGLKVYPNPFTHSATIEFSVEGKTNVNLEIYNIYGQKVKTLVNSTLAGGKHAYSWDGTNDVEKLVPSGIYFCRISQGGRKAEVKRLILNR